MKNTVRIDMTRRWMIYRQKRLAEGQSLAGIARILRAIAQTVIEDLRIMPACKCTPDEEYEER